MHTNVSLLDLQALEKLREEELEEARAIQSVMLPSESLRAGPVTISHEFQPMAAVGGDFLDYFELTDGTIGLYLGDVSGKGLPAALYAALAVGTLRGVHKTGTPPREVPGLLNRRLVLRGIPRRYAAIQYALFNPRTREMRIASAGMLGPFHLSGDGCDGLHLSGIPPGLFLEASYDCLTIQLKPGDSVLFFTDGLTDATDSHGEQFDIARLQGVCCVEPFAGTEELLSKIFASVNSFASECEQKDDMTAALFHFAG
jgi:phosphoserine phosphatase RsbU/P